MKKLYGSVSVFLLLAGSAPAQWSPSAYRGLGQLDLRQNGINRVLGVEMHAPGAVALDYRDGSVRLYVSDTQNNRVLGWRDARSYQMGDPPTVVLGQPSLQHSRALGIGVRGLNAPLGLAVDPITGNLYVADAGNNRVLRFPNPMANPGRVEPDAVYGQVDFNGRSANPNGIGRGSLNAPRWVAFDGLGNLWIADTGNHRVLRYSVASLDRTEPEAELVLGQPDFISGAANRGTAVVSASGFNAPTGLAVDGQGNLYVSDFNNARVLKFTAPIVTDAAAAAVFGQPGFTTRSVSALASNNTLAGPMGLALDNAGNLHVAVPGDNRVMTFAANAPSGAPARDVLGQTDFSSTQPNPFTFPLASARSFASPVDVKADPDGNLFVADTGNHRVLSFQRGSKTAANVWGQANFSANGVNQVKPGSLNSPYQIAVDYSRAPYPLYVSDTNNHRVLIWKEAARFRNGDPADMVIGQPDFSTAVPNVDTRGLATPAGTTLAFPKGLVTDAAGNLYVADSGNHRVLRYPRPVDQLGRIMPDLVLGQAGFNTSTSAAVSASSLRSPSGVAIGPEGNLFVADTGNNRVLEYPVALSSGAAAIRVYGQPNFTTPAPLSPASAQTLLAPQGLYVDAASTLYVADTGNNRVLVFSNTRDAAAAGMPASIVIGQGGFETSAAGGGPSGLNSPTDVRTDDRGNIVVADSRNNRVLVFPSLLFIPLTGAAAEAVLGQQNLTGASVNWNSPDGLATPEGLAGPQGVFVDRQGTVYVADSGNHRVVHFLKPLSVRSAANAQAGVPLARGGMAVATGSGFAEIEQSAPGTPWPLSLAGREVVINDQTAAPLASLGPENISFQVPLAAPLGTQRIAVRAADTGELIAGSAVTLAAVSPGLYSGAETKLGVLNQDGTANSAANPASKGSTIKVFGTGQGPVSPQIADGQAAPEEPPIATIAVPTTDANACLANQPSLCVTVGNTFGEIQFSGLAPGMVGIWQLVIKIPATAPSGNAVPLRAVINGVPSNIITVAIRP